jgi:hypothetical protein
MMEKLKRLAAPLTQYYLEYSSRRPPKTGLVELFSHYLSIEDVAVEISAHMGL